MKPERNGGEVSWPFQPEPSPLPSFLTALLIALAASFSSILHKFTVTLPPSFPEADLASLQRDPWADGRTARKPEDKWLQYFSFLFFFMVKKPSKASLHP